jgi:hypothetical protein
MTFSWSQSGTTHGATRNWDSGFIVCGSRAEVGRVVYIKRLPLVYRAGQETRMSS